MAKEKPTITPSEVILVIRGGPPKNTDPEASRAGIRAHQEVRRRIERGEPPPCLRGIEKNDPEFEKSLRREIGPNGLTLSARADVMTRGAVIEIKPKPLKGRHLLQTAMECATGRKTTGVVYLYDGGGNGPGEAVVIPDGAQDLWPKLEGIAREARKILDLQGQIDEKRSGPRRGEKTVRGAAERNKGNTIGFACEIEGMGRESGAHRKGLGYQIVDERQRFDKEVDEVLKELERRVKR